MAGARRVTIDGLDQIDPRHTRAWRALRDQVVREEPLCWLALPGVCTKVSTTGDHVIPVTERPELTLVRSNVRGACKPCNDKRSNLPVSALGLAPRDPALAIFD